VWRTVGDTDDSLLFFLPNDVGTWKKTKKRSVLTQGERCRREGSGIFAVSSPLPPLLSSSHCVSLSVPLATCGVAGVVKCTLVSRFLLCWGASSFLSSKNGRPFVHPHFSLSSPCRYPSRPRIARVTRRRDRCPHTRRGDEVPSTLNTRAAAAASSSKHAAMAASSAVAAVGASWGKNIIRKGSVASHGAVLKPASYASASPLAPAASGSGRRLDGRIRTSSIRKAGAAASGSRPRVGRGSRLVVRASSASGEPRWVQNSSSSSTDEDPITGALHQASNLRERLAEVGNNWSGVAPTGGVNGAAAVERSRSGDKEDWKEWQRTFDRVDAEEGILDALEVRSLHTRWAFLFFVWRRKPPPLPPSLAATTRGALRVCTCVLLCSWFRWGKGGAAPTPPPTTQKDAKKTVSWFTWHQFQPPYFFALDAAPAPSPLSPFPSGESHRTRRGFMKPRPRRWA
jgi:hypothetical protein